MESIESASSFRSLPSLHIFPTGHSTCSFRGLPNSAESSRSQEEAPLPGVASREPRRSGGGVFSDLQERLASQELSKPWQRLGGRESRRAARSHALLYLALTDPVLSATALLCTRTAKRNRADPCTKEWLEQDSSLASVSALLGFACIVLLFAFVSGVAVGSALVRSRPSLGSAIIAVVPDGVHVDKSGWESDSEFSAYSVDSLVLLAGITKGEEHATKEHTVAVDAKPPGGQAGQNVKGVALRKSSAFVLVLPQERPDPSEPLVVLKGAFTLYLPQHNQSWIGGTQSGVFFLEYIPAPLAGRLSKDFCFLPHTGLQGTEPTSERTDANIPASSLREDKKGQSLLSEPHGEEPQFNEGGQAARAGAPVPFATKPVPAVSAAVTASARLTAVEPSAVLLEASKRHEQGSGGSTSEISLKNVKDTIKQLEPYARTDASQLLLNLGTYLPLQGDTILSEAFDGWTANDAEPENQKVNAQQPAPEVLPSSADEHQVARHSLHATPSTRISYLLELFEGKNARGWARTTLSPAAPATSARRMAEELDSQEPHTTGPQAHHSGKYLSSHFHENSNKVVPSPATTDNSRRSRRKTGNNSPRLLAASFHPLIDAQAGGFQVFEVVVTLSHKVFSRDMYEDLLRDCQLGRVYVQLSTALAYYTLFYWKDVEYHKYLPFPLGCVVQDRPPTRDSLEGLNASH
ncbi:hypothetical protein Esti_002162 [Eimeria stiedai]